MRYICTAKNMEFHACHGLYEEEKIIGGKFLVDLEVETEKPDLDELNDLQKLVNYEELYLIAEKAMGEREDLIEKVAAKMLRQINAAFKGITRSEVSITKCNPAGRFKSGQAYVRLVR